jgi:hypothetical protein
MVVPPEPIDFTLGDGQLNCSSRQELSIGMLKVQKNKMFDFFGTCGSTGRTDRVDA